ncbi:MAG: potassium-transporting ATPase subunit KdpA [Deltaproteobacteria bacterium]|nr:potassium-transporting ATPase subunit KdpA [Deltaproteobacteria bacterium]
MSGFGGPQAGSRQANRAPVRRRRAVKPFSPGRSGRFRFAFSLGRVLERVLHPTQVLILSFGLTIAVGTALLMLPWASTKGTLGFVNALFTATSATCVTGLAVVDTGTQLSLFGQCVVLALIQLGGLGIMTYSSVFLLIAGGRLSFRGRLIVHETLGRKKGQLSVRRLVRDVFAYTFLIEGVGALALTAVFSRTRPPLEALAHGAFHSVSAFCNAGFSLYATSFMEYRGDWLLNWTVMLLIVLGGTGFIVLEDLFDAWRARRAGRSFHLSLHSKVVLAATGVLILAGALAIWAFERGNALAPLPWHEAALASLFQSITARTAGFNTLDYATLTSTTLFFTILLMFVGASPGSCGGGIKTTTFSVVLALFRDRLLARDRVRLFRRVLPDELVARSVALLVASFVFITALVLVLSGLEIGAVPYSDRRDAFLGLFFEAVSAFGTVGLSTGVTAALSPAGKLLITLAMFVGRLGPLTMVVAISRKSGAEDFQYAEEGLMVG